MKLITSANLINITEKTFNYVDNRITGHARGVAYITYSVMRYIGGYTEHELHGQFMMALLHDIGANKTNDVDELLTFDNDNTLEHTVYGSLFLKTFMPLGDGVQSVLYHHLPYKDYGRAWHSLSAEHFAGLICLADKVDLCLRGIIKGECVELLQNERGAMLSPFWVDAFLALNSKENIIAKLKAANYDDEYDVIIKSFRFSREEKERALEMLAYSIDFRSSFMVMHTITTHSISKSLALLFDLTQEQIYEIVYGAILHDIGKIASPVEILEKPDKLTDDEMRVMREHVVLTREIIGEFLKPSICEIAVRHHERLDGSGYPQGLLKAELTLSQRIVAVADVVSALVRKRSYKAAFNKELTISILQKTRDAGQLCPQVIKVLIDNFDDIFATATIESEGLIEKYNEFKSKYISVVECVNKSLSLECFKDI